MYKHPTHFYMEPANKEVSSHENNKKYGNITLNLTMLSKKNSNNTPHHIQVSRTIEVSKNYTFLTIQSSPTPPLIKLQLKEWIEELTTIGCITRTDVHKITTKQTASNCKIIILEYRLLLNTKPKKYRQKKIYPTTNTPFDCLRNTSNNILTNLIDIT